MTLPSKPVRILITGFGPFPGAPANPTGPLVRALARRLRRDASAQIATHVFRTTYAAVDRDLPRLIARKQPQAILMFGLATRSRALRVEVRARNRICRFPDAAGYIPARRIIAADGPAALPIRAPKAALLRAAKSGALPARFSVNAGDYLCNYAYWHALLAVKRGSLRRAAFIHVPPLAKSKTDKSGCTLDELVACAEAITKVMIRALS